MIDNDAKRYFDVLHNVRTGIRYHLRRQAFFEKWHRITGVISLVFSSAAVFAFFQEAKLAGAAAAIVAVAQALDLMFETRKHSEVHRELRQRYQRIEPELLAFESLDEKRYSKFMKRVSSIEIDEPPVKATLLLLCQNEAGVVTGHDPSVQVSDWYTKLNWLQRTFPNLLP